MNEVDLVRNRLKGEEALRLRPYNDADGKTVTCKPGGNVTVGWGTNIELIDREEADWLFEHRLDKIVVAIKFYPWYEKCNAVRRSVLLDIGYNEGLHGLLSFPHMLKAIGEDNWAEAQKQCMVEDPRLKARYEALGVLLFTGELPSVT